MLLYRTYFPVLSPGYPMRWPLRTPIDIACEWKWAASFLEFRTGRLILTAQLAASNMQTSHFIPTSFERQYLLTMAILRFAFHTKLVRKNLNLYLPDFGLIPAKYSESNVPESNVPRDTKFWDV